MRANNKIVDELKTRWSYRRRLIRIAALLILVIAVLATIQWAIGTRGWDLMAGLLTIVMVVLGFALAGVLVGIFRGRPVIDKETQQLHRSKPHWLGEMEESLDNDPHVVGSKAYRILKD